MLVEVAEVLHSRVAALIAHTPSESACRAMVGGEQGGEGLDV